MPSAAVELAAVVDPVAAVDLLDEDDRHAGGAGRVHHRAGAAAARLGIGHVLAASIPAAAA